MLITLVIIIIYYYSSWWAHYLILIPIIFYYCTVLEKFATDLAEEAQTQATVDIPVAAEMELLTAEMDRMGLEADVANAVTARAQMNVAHIDLERDLAKRALDSFHNRLDSTYIYILLF